jgi:hypothetical protein
MASILPQPFKQQMDHLIHEGLIVKDIPSKAGKGMFAT